MSITTILILDIGTSSTRAMLFDEAACAIPDCIAQVPNHLHTTAEGGVEFDPAHLQANLVAVIDQLLAQAANAGYQIGAVATATFVGNILGVDTQGVPITPLITYADNRNAEDAAALRSELGTAGMHAAHERTGTLVHAAYWPARFRWLQRTQPAWLHQTQQWVTLGDYLYYQFFGRWGVSYSVAAWSGLLNRHTLQWDDDWLAVLNDQGQPTTSNFSALIDVDQPYTGLQTHWARRWPQLAAIPWLPAIGDGAAANLGSGCDHPAAVALTIGTTGAMRAIVPPAMAQVPDGLWLYRVDRQRGLLGGATSEGGNLFAWLRNTLQLPAPAELEAALAGAKPAAHGLTLLPFIAGERAPGWQDSARASLVNFTQHTRPVEIVQAAIEGVAYRLAIIHERLAMHLPADHQVIASGGALLSSPAWLQIMADVLGHPVTALEEKEITARGLAVLALGVTAGTSAPMPVLGQTFIPIASHHALHRQAMARQVQIYQALVVT